MKTQYYAAASLDGFIADANDSLEWLFQFGGGPGEDYQTFINQVGAICMGSRTYEWILRHQVQPEHGEPQPWPYSQPAWVFTSRTLTKPDDADVRFTSGDLRQAHQEMVSAAAGKNVWVLGGGELVSRFHDNGLLDELFLHIAPVILGSGAPLIARPIVTPPLQLVSADTNEAGFLKLHYEVRR